MDAPDPAAWSEDPWYLADLAWVPCYVTGWTAANDWSLTTGLPRHRHCHNQRVRQVEQELAVNGYLVHQLMLSFSLGDCVSRVMSSRIAHRPSAHGRGLLDSPAFGGGIRHVGDFSKRTCWMATRRS